jgi:hypothetical protein
MKYQRELEHALKIFNRKWAAIGFGGMTIISIYTYLTRVRPSPYPTSTEEIWLFIIMPVVIAVMFGFIFSGDMMN